MEYDDTRVGDLPNELFDQLVTIYTYDWVAIRSIRAGTRGDRVTIRARLCRMGLLEANGNRDAVFVLYNKTIEQHANRVLGPRCRKSQYGHQVGFVITRRIGSMSAHHFFTGEAEDGRLMTFDSASAVHSYSRRILGTININLS